MTVIASRLPRRRFSRRISILVFALLLLLPVVSVAQNTYNVGPGQPLASVGAVPWNALQAGDTVNIHWRSTPYHEKIILSRSGTASQPININGVPGPQGALPILDATNATSSPNSPQFGYPPIQDSGLIVVFHDNAGSPNPSFININGLQLQGANPGTAFKGYANDNRTYSPGSGGVWVMGAADITIKNCTIINNGNGVFAKTGNGLITYRLTLDGNTISGNGVSGSYLEHNSYIEAYGATYQFNKYGLLRNGSAGNNLKDRSSSTIIRNNYFLNGGHILDLNEPQDGFDDISQDPNYLKTYVYGNVMISDQDGPTLLVHFGDGGGVGNYRDGATLYFYNNTLISKANQSARWRTNLFQMEHRNLSVDARNNILLNIPNTPGNTPTLFELGTVAGNINFPTTNWVSAGWLLSYQHEFGNPFDGTITGTENFFSPVNNNPGFVDLVTYNVRLKEDSNARDKGSALASGSFPLSFQYREPASGESRPVNMPLDLGAYEYSASNGGIPPSPPRRLRLKN